MPEVLFLGRCEETSYTIDGLNNRSKQLDHWLSISLKQWVYCCYLCECFCTGTWRNQRYSHSATMPPGFHCMLICPYIFSLIEGETIFRVFYHLIFSYKCDHLFLSHFLFSFPFFYKKIFFPHRTIRLLEWTFQTKSRMTGAGGGLRSEKNWWKAELL